MRIVSHSMNREKAQPKPGSLANAADSPSYPPAAAFA
jgi:hypothetical protein